MLSSSVWAQYLEATGTERFWLPQDTLAWKYWLPTCLVRRVRSGCASAWKNVKATDAKCCDCWAGNWVQCDLNSHLPQLFSTCISLASSSLLFSGTWKLVLKPLKNHLQSQRWASAASYDLPLIYLQKEFHHYWVHKILKVLNTHATTLDQKSPLFLFKDMKLFWGSQYVRWSTRFMYEQQPLIATITTVHSWTVTINDRYDLCS